MGHTYDIHHFRVEKSIGAFVLSFESSIEKKKQTRLNYGAFS